MEQKMKISQAQSKYFNGYRGPRTTNVGKGEGLDVKETVSVALQDVGLWLIETDWLAIFPTI